MSKDKKENKPKKDADKAVNKIVKTIKEERKYLYLLIALFVFLVVWSGRSLLIAATVNGRPISRLALIKELEHQGGADVLDNLIDQALIFQEGRSANVDVSAEVINEEIAQIEEILEAQGTSLDEALALRGQTRKMLEEQIKLQKVVEAILADRVSVTDNEVEEAFEQNREFYEEGTILEDVFEDLHEQLYQQKLGTEYQNWIVEVRAEARINYLVTF